MDKIVILLVEGKSEINALRLPLENIFDDIKYHHKKCRIVFGLLEDETSESSGGDVTTRFGVSPKTIRKKINDNMISPVLNKYKFFPKDVEEIIQIVDMDGAYIPKENIVPELADDETKVSYKDGKIYALNPDNIIKRNIRKCKNLEYLQLMTYFSIEHQIQSIKNGKISVRTFKKQVPYSIYYFSSNLDHYIHHDANLEDRLKLSLARDFSRRCNDDKKVFYSLFVEDADSICDTTYKDSWEFIKNGTNSVDRHTNLGMFIKCVTQLK